MEREIRLNEIFFSIEGEGKKAGIPSLFIRVGGCKVGCSFCDEEKAKHTFYFFTIKEAINLIKNNIKTLYETSPFNNEDDFLVAPFVKRIVITGGNPIEQFDVVIELSSKLKNLVPKISLCLQHPGVLHFKEMSFNELKSYIVEHIKILIRAFDELVVDLKPPSSGVWERFNLNISKTFITCLNKNNDKIRKVDISFNFPFQSKNDLTFFIREFLPIISNKTVYLTPIRDKNGNLIDNQTITYALSLIKRVPFESDVRLGFQIHKIYNLE